MQDPKVSIVILVHNALFCVIRTLNSLRKTRGVIYETVVVDNDSRLITKIVLLLYFVMKRINRLLFVGENTLFSKGNNLGSRISSEDSTHILLLNSDVRINRPDWLSVLLKHHERGAISFGIAGGNDFLGVQSGEEFPKRADGFCFLIDRHVYLTYQLDEHYQHWWSLPELQARLLKAGLRVKAIRDYDDWITHFGGKSGKVRQRVNTPSKETVGSWFDGSGADIIDRV